MTTRTTTYFQPNVSRDGDWVPFSKKMHEVEDDARANAADLIAGGETSVLLRQIVVTYEETDLDTITA